VTARTSFIALILSCVLAGCGANAATPVPSPFHIESPVSRPIHDVAAGLAEAYAGDSWTRIHQLVPDRSVADRLIGEMQSWQRAGAGRIAVTPVYHQSGGLRRAIVTLAFSDDPRAPPSYLIAVMNTGTDPAHIIGTTTGLRGTMITNTTWTVTRARNFIFYHSPYQATGADRVYINDLEQQRRTFARKFGVRLPPLAAYYLYPTVSIMAHRSGGTCGTEPGNVGCATPFTSPPTIQTILWPTYHEPIHVYERALEPRPTAHEIWYAPLFIAEGTAVALEDRQVDPRLSDYCSLNLAYVPLDSCARLYLGSTHPLSLLPDRGFRRARPGAAYALSGSFVKYLILHYGYHRFGRFYYRLSAQPSDNEKDYDAATLKIYGRSIRALLAAWERQLA